MLKKLLFIFCILLLCGCKQIDDNNNYIDKVYDCLQDKKITNEVSLGYKYYLPKGVKKIKDYDYNQVFLVDSSYLYLYVDVISFFHKEKLNKPTINAGSYYESFNYNDKEGYILIEEEEKQYYLNIVYNYSKIEGFVLKENINKVVTLSSIILNSIDYNHTVIEKILEGDLGQFYEVDKPEGASSNFSQYLEEYVQKDENTEQLPDE